MADAGRLASAHATVQSLWERLAIGAPEHVRLHDLRIDMLLDETSKRRPTGADLVARIAASRSPRRVLDEAAVYWLYQHTSPRGLPASFVQSDARPRPTPYVAPVDDDADDTRAAV